MLGNLVYIWPQAQKQSQTGSLKAGSSQTKRKNLPALQHNTTECFSIGKHPAVAMRNRSRLCNHVYTAAQCTCHLQSEFMFIFYNCVYIRIYRMTDCCGLAITTHALLLRWTMYFQVFEFSSRQ